MPETDTGPDTSETIKGGGPIAMKTRKEKAELTFNKTVLKREGEEYIGRREEPFGRTNEITAVSMKYIKAKMPHQEDMIQVTETTFKKERDLTEKWDETGSTMNRMNFDLNGKLVSAVVEFSIGERKFPIDMNMEPENKRMGAILSHLKEAGFDPNVVEFTVKQPPFTGYVFGYAGKMDSTFTIINKHVREDREGRIDTTTGQGVSVRAHRLYNSEGKFETLFAQVSDDSGSFHKMLDKTFDVSFHETVMTKLLASEEADKWKKEMAMRGSKLG